MNGIRPSVDYCLSNKASSCQQHLPNSSGNTKGVVKPVSIKTSQLLRGKRLERESIEPKSADQMSGQSGSLASCSGGGNGESSNIAGGEDEMSLMCPMCSFSSSSRDVIMKHVVESH